MSAGPTGCALPSSAPLLPLSDMKDRHTVMRAKRMLTASRPRFAPRVMWRLWQRPHWNWLPARTGRYSGVRIQTAGRLFSQTASRLVMARAVLLLALWFGWLVGWMSGWLVGWLVGWHWQPQPGRQAGRQAFGPCPPTHKHLPSPSQRPPPPPPPQHTATQTPPCTPSQQYAHSS